MEKDISIPFKILRNGTRKANEVTDKILQDAKSLMKIDYNFIFKI